MSTKDKCMLCHEDINEHDYISPCECMKIHPECNDTCIKKLGTKCMICKKEFVKPKIYFAGKMSSSFQSTYIVDTHCDDGYVYEEEEEDENGGLNTSRCGADTIFCISKNKFDSEIIHHMNSAKNAGFGTLWNLLRTTLEIKRNNFISKGDYYDNNKPIKIVSKEKYNLVGPVLHIYKLEDDILEAQHGSVGGEPLRCMNFLLRDLKQIDKRNKEMIDSCDVFSFTCDLTAYRSLSEWGSADEKNKILVLCENLIQNKKINDSFKENFRFNILDSLESFKRLTSWEKNLIIYSHPLLPFNTFDEYKSYLDED